MRQWSAAALQLYRRTHAQHSCCAHRTRRLCSGAAGLTDAEKISQLRAGVAPGSGRPLKEIAAEVWGWNTNPVGSGHRSGAKILRRPLRGPLYMEWYPPRASENKLNPFRLSEKQERWRAKLRLLRAAGKGPPKKGAGKRSK